jgi:hypothetical protein
MVCVFTRKNMTLGPEQHEEEARRADSECCRIARARRAKQFVGIRHNEAVITGKKLLYERRFESYKMNMHCLG